MKTRTFLKILIAPILAPLIDLYGADRRKPASEPIRPSGCAKADGEWIACTFGELRDGAIFSPDFDGAPECFMKVGNEAVGFNEADGKRICLPDCIRVRTPKKPVIIWYYKNLTISDFARMERSSVSR